MPASWPSGCATPAACSSAPIRRCRSVTTAPARITCCRPAAPPGTRPGLSVQSFLKGMQLVEYDEAALLEVAPHVLALSAAEDLPAHGAAVAARLPMSARSDDPGRPAAARRAARRAALRRAAARRRGAAEHQREPVPAVGGRRSPTSPRRWPRSPASSTAIPTAMRSRCAPISPHTSTATAATGLTAANVWAANGSNEIMLQLLQAFGGPGRDGAVLRADLLDVPRVRPRHAHRLGRRRRGPATSRSTSIARSPLIERTPARRHPAGLAEQPDRHRARRRPRSRRSATCAPGMVIVDEAYAEFRRAGTPSALALLPGRPRLVVTRTMSKAFALAGGRLGYLAADPAVVDAVSIVRLPYHLSAVSQVVARVALAHARRAAGPGRRSCGPSATPPSTWLRSIGLQARRLRRELRAVRPLRRSPRRMAGLAGSRRADP